MRSTIITPERFRAIINSIPKDALGAGVSLDGVRYSYARQKSGTYKGEPYTKPAHIQITANGKRFWIEWAGHTLEFSHDPTGGFNHVPLTEPDSLAELEGYFIRLESHLQTVDHKQRAAGGEELNVDMEDLRAFIQTVLPWCDEDQRVEVQQATRLALTAPRQYLQENREQLARRGIDRPVRDLYLIALVDGMRRVGGAAEVDWKADYESVFWQISAIAKNFALNVQEVTDDSALQTHEVLRRLGKTLESQGHVLASIDIDSDSYVLYILPDTAYSRSAELAKNIGVEVGRF